MNETQLAAVERHIDEHFDGSLQELMQYCRQPSISAQGVGMHECAQLTGDLLRAHGFATEQHATAGHPIVTGYARGAGTRTLLLYNHYDVQPPEPLELWTSPPFEPVVRDGMLFARGVSDDKGHVICRLMALDAVRAVLGELPCTVKFLVEGEEEVGSKHLAPFIAAERERLAADACLWEFGGVNYREQPVITAGLRGMCYVELRVRTANQDAHSGLGGSIFQNAAWRLTWALATLKGLDERVRLPGHYDAVRPASARDLELLAAFPAEDEALRTRYGLGGFLGEASGVELLRRMIFEPTCTICGLDAGYQGPGSKTVLPAEASAKVDFRLVPDQDPETVRAALRAHLDAHGFSDVEIIAHSAQRPGRVDPDHPFLRLTIDTAREVYGVEPCVEPLSGGTGPIDPFLRELRVPVATCGLGYPGTRAHAPDENIRLADLARAAKHTARIVMRMGEW